MRIQIASDLHLESYPGRRPPAAAFRPAERDVLVLAGDIGTGMLARDFVLRELARSPVIYVPGNHEYYRFALREEIDDDWRDVADRQPELHYLVAEGVDIAGVRFWGAPWYSDLWGARDARTLADITASIHDFAHPPYHPWGVHDHLAAHERQTELLEAEAGRVDVVVTHWPPTRQAMHPKFEGDALNPYFYNDREDLIPVIGAQLWISGHTHEAWDLPDRHDPLCRQSRRLPGRAAGGRPVPPRPGGRGPVIASDLHGMQLGEALQACPRGALRRIWWTVRCLAHRRYPLHVLRATLTRRRAARAVVDCAWRTVQQGGYESLWLYPAHPVAWANARELDEIRALGEQLEGAAGKRAAHWRRWLGSLTLPPPPAPSRKLPELPW